jgi:hypothetical protein
MKMIKKTYFKFPFWGRVRLSDKHPKHPLAIKGWNGGGLTGQDALGFLEAYSKIYQNKNK